MSSIFNVRASSTGAFGGSSSASQLVNAAQTPIYQPQLDTTITELNATTINVGSLDGNSGTNVYETLGTEKIVHPPTNALTVGGVNPSVLNKRTRTSQAAATACVSTWTSRSSSSNSFWHSICWSSELNLFCAVARSASNAVMTSPDGVNWTTQTSPGEDNQWWSVCWSPELGLFCSVSFILGTTNSIMTSPDGVNWTLRSHGDGDTCDCVCWSPELGLFCAVGYGTKVIVSVDGINWVAHTVDTDEYWRTVCWSPELGLFCALSFQYGMTSPDGVNWTTYTLPFANDWYSICWAPELGLFCTVAGYDEYDENVMTSPDGVNWTVRLGSENNFWYSVCWSPELGIFCAVSESDGFLNHVMTSPDGINWTTRTSARNNDWNSVCWSPELSIFCAVSGTGSGNRVMTSTIGMPNSQSVLKTNPSYVTVTQTGNVGISTAAPSERLEVTGNILASGTITPFTGAHITPSVFTLKDIGKLVSSTGHIQDISINNAWPRTVLCSTEKDPAVYGVISEIKDNGTALVNGVGEGAIWVSNRNGSVSKGELLVSSPLPGYTQKQGDDVIHNYTAARAIMDCSFDEKETKDIYRYQKTYTYRLESTDDKESFKSRAFPDAKYYIKLEKSPELETVVAQVKEGGSISIGIENSQLDENLLSITFPVEQADGSNKSQTFELSYTSGEELFLVHVDVSGTWEVINEETVPAYNVKYLDALGEEITAEDYEQSLKEKKEVYKAALIGCIYLCG